MPVKKKKFIDKFLKVWCLPYLKINPKIFLGIYLLFCWLIYRQGCKQTHHQNSHTKQDDKSVDYCIHMDIIPLIITFCNSYDRNFFLFIIPRLYAIQ